MVIEAPVNKLSSRAILIALALGVSLMLAFAALTNFAAGVVTDERAKVDKQLMAATIAYVPNSARLHARLAEAEMGEEDRDISSIENHVKRAIDLSPWDYRQRLLLATVKEAQGDRAAAEQSLLEAAALAPNYTEVRWRLANLLVREGKLVKAVGEFRTAVSANASLLPGTLDLLWRVSAGNLTLLRAVTPKNPKSQLLLAQFLLKQERVPDAITVFGGIDHKTLAGLPETPGFIDSLIAQRYFEEARGLFVGLVSGVYAQPGHPLPLVWNGSFESDISKSLAQFDWTINRNEYALPSIDSASARTGSRSLRIDFTGLDTTRMDGQVKQMVIVKPGSRYRLECYVRTDRLETPEGPRIVVMDPSSTEIVRSDPIPAGSGDWRAIKIDFTAPASKIVLITIKRVPRFSYDHPTSGSVYFDDFELVELNK